ncbi:MAG: tetratricopeptide repeat protein [Victivallales bacterium]|nr:tetratricopeptide repeat protein [Victivallales bacterium]
MVALGLTVLLVLMAHRHQNHRRLFQNARTAYANEDYAEAEAAFTRYLKIDPNQEEAWHCLAEIYREQGDSFQEARCWRRLIRLNPLNEEYLRECLQTLYRNHDYAKLNDTFLRMPDGKYLDYHELYTLTRFKLAPMSPDTLKLIEELDPESTTARLINALRTPGPASELAILEESDDPVVQVEAFIQDAALAEWREKDYERAEHCFRRAVEINPMLCRGELGSFLSRCARYQEAVEVFREVPESFLTSSATLDYAEALFHEKDIDGLKNLAQRVPQSQSGYISSRAYINSLAALLENQPAEMVKNFNVAKIQRNTRPGLMLRYAVAIESKDARQFCTVLSAWKRTTLFPQRQMDILAHAQPLLDLALQKKQWDLVAELAGYFLDVRPAEEKIWHAYILALAATRGVPDAALDQAIRLFPQSEFFRSLALRAVAATGDLPGTLAAFDQLIEVSGDSTLTRYRKILFLEVNGQLDEAVLELQKLLESDPSLTNRKRCLAFGIRTGRREALDLAAQEPSLSAFAEFEKERRYGDIQRAEAFLKETQIEQGLSAELQEDRELMLPLAIYLALVREHSRAIALYEALAPYLTQDPTIDLNLSEIYADLGDMQRALQYAEQANRRFPQSALAQAVYGVRCAENGDFQKAADLIPDSANDPKFREILLTSLEKNLESNLAAQRYSLCRSIANRILNLQPGHARAQECLDLIAQLQSDDATPK